MLILFKLALLVLSASRSDKLTVKWITQTSLRTSNRHTKLQTTRVVSL